MSVTRICEVSPARRWPAVTVLGVPVWAGWPSPAQDYCDGTIDLSAHLIPRPAATFLVRAAGNSMAGAGISDGDELIVDRSLHACDGQIVIAVLDGEFVVKTWRTNPARLQSCPHPDHSTDQAFSDIVVSDREVEVWGVVTYVLHHAPLLRGAFDDDDGVIVVDDDLVMATAPLVVVSGVVVGVVRGCPAG